MNEFEKTGCLTCSLKIKNDYNKLNNDEIDKFIENFTNRHKPDYKYKATGRYD
jgi:thymidine phosphorylase